jgi:hypothetical protein
MLRSLAGCKTQIAQIYFIALFSIALTTTAVRAQENELTVSLDSHAYHLRELDLLEDTVGEAARARLGDIGLDSNFSAIDVIVWNEIEQKEFSNAISKLAIERQFPFETVATKAFWIRLSPDGLASRMTKRLEEPAYLEGYIDNLRPGLPGVTILPEPTSAIVQSNDPAFDATLTKLLGDAFLVAPVTTNSWRVSWNSAFWQSISPKKRDYAIAHMAETIRQFLGDPTDLAVYVGGITDKDGGQGVHFFIRDPNKHAPFIDAIRKAFNQNPLFNYSEIDAIDARITLPARKPPSILSKDFAQDPQFELTEAIQNEFAPPFEAQIANDGVVISAKKQAQGRELIAIVQRALAGRKDLAVKPMPNDQLRIELAPGAHIGPSIPTRSARDFANAVQDQAAAMGTRSAIVTPIDSEHSRIKFVDHEDEEKFRATLAKASGLAIRLAIREKQASSDSSPSDGNELMTLPNGVKIWVSPDVILSGDMVASASVGQNKFLNEPTVQFQMTDEGRQRFATATRQHVGQQFVIIVDGIAVEAPMIGEPILGGIGEIAGGFTAETANSLVSAILRHHNDLLLSVVDDAEK